MINAITTKDHDPKEAFQNLWLNTENDSLWVWHGKPIRVGFSKSGSVIVGNVFNMDFVFTPKKNDQIYEHVFEYDKIPLLVMAQIECNDYEGSDVEVYFGSLYGEVHVGSEDFIILNQMGNVSLGEDIIVKCEPTSGALKVKLIVISYE